MPREAFDYAARLFYEQRLVSRGRFPHPTDVGMPDVGLAKPEKDKNGIASFALECRLRDLLGIARKTRLGDYGYDLPNLEVRIHDPQWFDTGDPYIVRKASGELRSTLTAHWDGDGTFELRWLVEPWMYSKGAEKPQRFLRFSGDLMLLMKPDAMLAAGAHEDVWDRMKMTVAVPEV